MKHVPFSMQCIYFDVYLNSPYIHVRHRAKYKYLSKFQKLIGHALWLLVKADTKYYTLFQLLIIAIPIHVKMVEVVWMEYEHGQTWHPELQRWMSV